MRAQTLAEIQDHAFALVDAEGAHLLSLTAIANAMGISGPALYRYFPSRDALLAQLVSAAYGQLADALDEAASRASRRAPEARLRALVAAYRDWALAHPRRYAMLFGERPDGARDTEEALMTIDRGMNALLTALLDLGAPGDAPPPTGRPLIGQLRDWSARYNRSDVQPRVLLSAALMWTRMHGIVSLELAHVFEDMGLDAGLLLDVEVDAVIRLYRADPGA